MEPFEWDLPGKTGHSDDFKQVKSDSHFANFGQVKTDPIHSI